ncbi:MAG: DUF2798 domain-containing protein [Cytophagales bacterium CG18_big_fil_WC_8_21_14_2_50_42_9]|nr:MAG: DUF2798 domain-containing protein [Cytophagales bacterium CG18_big_fil_WC_8_21_14_2_50_42_9]
MGKRRIKAKSTIKPKAKKVFNTKELFRNLLVIFLISFFISTALIIYLFGWTDDFFSRLFWCLLVVYLLISITVLGIVPLANRLVNR